MRDVHRGRVGVELYPLVDRAGGVGAGPGARAGQPVLSPRYARWRWNRARPASLDVPPLPSATAVVQTPSSNGSNGSRGRLASSPNSAPVADRTQTAGDGGIEHSISRRALAHGLKLNRTLNPFRLIRSVNEWYVNPVFNSTTLVVVLAAALLAAVMFLEPRAAADDAAPAAHAHRAAHGDIPIGDRRPAAAHASLHRNEAAAGDGGRAGRSLAEHASRGRAGRKEPLGLRCGQRSKMPCPSCATCKRTMKSRSTSSTPKFRRSSSPMSSWLSPKMRRESNRRSARRSKTCSAARPASGWPR